ncbi:MAG: tyrosine-type recombinase/integrase [Pseudomonadota bacterium]
MAVRITDKLARSLESPEKGNRITYDSEVRGFGLRVTASGAKAFVVNYRVGGRERRYTIGGYPDWSVVAAREEVKRLKRQVSMGFDPMGQRHEDRAAPTMADLCRRYLEDYAPRKAKRSQADEKSMLDKLVLPTLGRIKVPEVTPEDIDQLHREISKKTPIRANRVAQLLSRIFTLAIRWELRSDNPVKGLEKNPETRRTRYLSPEELGRLMTMLREHPNRRSANAVQLLVLTGARRGEVLNATWDQFDLEEGLWIKPSSHTKQKKEHRVPLSSQAIELLLSIKAEAPPSPFVFPGKSNDQPLTDLKNFWRGVCKKAELQGIRIHDLRHAYASLLVSSGLSLPVIGALLGHTQPQTTARYSHLFDEPLREATEIVGKAISGNGVK